MAKVMTRESLAREVASNTVAQKYAKRIGLLESARKAVGAKPMSTFEKYYAGQLFENISKGNMFEGYTQGNFVGQNFRKDAFNIVSLAIQNTVLPEIVSVQPMSTAAQLLPIMELRYGTTKGEVTEGDLVLDATGAGKTNKNYDSKVVENQALPAAANYLAPFTPVDAGTVKIVLANGTVVTDDGAGALSDGGTIDYASGLVTPASAFVVGDKISYTYDNSIVPNYLYPELDGHNQHQVGDVTIGIRPELIEAEEHKIRAVYALTAAYKINKEYGVNMPLEFEKQVANEMNKERERVVMSDIFAQAAGGNAVVWSSTPRPGVSDAEHVESLPIAINLANAEIYNRTNGNLTPNFMVAGANVIAYLAKSKVFEANEAPKNGGSFLAGKLGTLTVYQTPAIGTNDFFIGGIGNDFWQAGYVVGDYMPITYTTPVTLADYTTQQRMGFYIWKENGKPTTLHQRKNYSLIIAISSFIEHIINLEVQQCTSYYFVQGGYLMYPYEVAEFLKQRNYYIGGDDLIKITSIKENPQLNHIKYNAWTNEYEMWDVEGNYYKFTAMPYKEAVEKGLVKQKDEDYER